MDVIDLKTFRVAMDLSQSEMGAVLGMPGNAISRLENGDRELTQVHRAALNMFEYIVGNDMLDDFMTCLYKQGKLKSFKG